MSKSELTGACYALDPDRVRALIVAGAAVDGSDGAIWRGDATGCRDGAPYYTPLGEACRSTDRGEADALAVVDALLTAGAPVDGRNYRDETPLHFAAQAGRPRLVARLLAAGADVAAVGCMGNALMVLATYYVPDAPGGPKVETLRALLDAGADPRQPDAFGRDLLQHVGDGPLADLAGSSRADKARARAIVELMRVVGEYAPGWPALHDWLERADAAWLAGDAKARKARAKLDGLVEQVGQPGFEKAARRAIGRTVLGRQAQLEPLTRRVLMHPAVVAHPAWSALVRALLELTADYGDLTEDAYGERLTLDDMEDDEGGVLDMYGDEQLSTVELCLTACAAPGAAERHDFAGLVTTICETKWRRIGYMSFGDDEAAALIASLTAAGHPEAEALAAVARRCFPYADWG